MAQRVLIVDDQAKLLDALRAILHSSGWSVCGEAMDGLEAVEKAKQLRPDLIIMDISMPRMGGVEVHNDSAGEATEVFLYEGAVSEVGRGAIGDGNPHVANGLTEARVTVSGRTVLGVISSERSTFFKSFEFFLTTKWAALANSGMDKYCVNGTLPIADFKS